MEDVRIGLVGAGAWGSNYAEKLARASGARLAAVADLDLERARRAADPVGADAVTDVETLLGRIDAAVVAVPARRHLAVARPLLEAGIPVLMEKPFATSVEEADRLAAAAAARGTLLQAAHLERFNPAVEAARELIVRPRFLEANRLGPFPGRGADVDVVLDLMVHDLDLVLEVVDAPVERISARGVAVISDEVDIANARLEFADGCVADLTASRVSLKRERKLRIFQENAYLSLDYAAQSLQIVRRRPAAAAGGWPEVEAEAVPVQSHDALEAQVAAFVAAVREGTPPVVGPAAGKRVLEIAVEIAAEIRRWS